MWQPGKCKLWGKKLEKSTTNPLRGTTTVGTFNKTETKLDNRNQNI